MNLELKVPNMVCGGCAETITQAVIEIDPQASVKADPESKKVVVNTKASESSVREAITSAGFNLA